tara:strand:+ start:476 stop:1123 length:648 start_codon:yes stop_codon:yes gene_type:complete
MKGKLIVLEGIDGCGKSTQIKSLEHWLYQNAIIPNDKSLILTREPGGTSLGIELREILLNTSQTSEPFPITELLLYSADRAQHISQLLIPNLNIGNWILSDRFSGSTLAYQGYGRGLNKSIIDQLEIIALQGIKPDLTIWLDISVKESLRRRSKKTKDRIEAEGELFLQKVSDGFAVIAKNNDWIRINANSHEEIISRKIQEVIINKFQTTENMS